MTELTLKQVRSEKDIHWVYWWLLVSSVFTWSGLFPEVPFRQGRYEITALWFAWIIIPAAWHVILLFGFANGTKFATFHTVQAILYAGIRFLAAPFFVIVFRKEGYLFIVVLWLGEWLFGLWEVGRGESWLMRFLGVRDELPRPWVKPQFEPTTVAAAPAPPSPLNSSVPTYLANQPKPLSPIEDQRATLLRGKNLVQQGQRAEAIQCFLTVFRVTTNAEIKRDSVEALHRLGQVETF